jgi:hypothetical protein
MNFEIDTKQKTITLLEDCTIKELLEITKWLGEDGEQYKLTQRTITLQQDRWVPWTYPAPSSPLVPYYGTGNPYKVFCTNDSITEQKYKITCSAASFLPPIEAFNN